MSEPYQILITERSTKAYVEYDKVIPLVLHYEHDMDTLVKAHAILAATKRELVGGPTSIWAIVDHAIGHVDAQIKQLLRSE